MNSRDRVLDAMRSGEWLRTQWIIRVAFGIGRGPLDAELIGRGLSVLRHLQVEGTVERREGAEKRRDTLDGKPVTFTIPRSEWRLKSTRGMLADLPPVDKSMVEELIAERRREAKREKYLRPS